MTTIISDENDSLKSIKMFRDILSHLYGPSKSYVVLQNTQGSMVNMSASSIDLFTYYQPKCDVVKLMLSFLRNDFSLYKDGGLFTALLSCNLILKTKYEELSLCVSMTGLDFFLSKICMFIDKLELTVNIGKLNDVYRIIRPILMSKLVLKSNELMHVSILFAKVFSKSSISNTDVQVIQDDSTDIEHSQLYEGVLLRLEQYFDKKNLPTQHIFRVLLVSVSVAIDSEELIADVGTKITTKSREKLKDDVIMNKLVEFCDQIVPYVNVIICQKVIHPLIKQYLKEKHILCIDRIGIHMMTSLEQILKCTKLSSLFVTEVQGFISCTSNMKFLTIGNKYFLQITSDVAMTTHHALVLCGRTEDLINRLNCCYESAMLSLKCLSTTSSVVYGAGCMETSICMYLNSLLRSTEDLTKQLNVPLNVINQLINVLIRSFLNVASSLTCESDYYKHCIDNVFHHHWIDPSVTSQCCCGMIERTNESFITFSELRNQMNPILRDDSTRKKYNHDDKSNLPSLTTPLVIYKSKIYAAFQLAQTVLRIGVRIVQP